MIFSFVIRKGGSSKKRKNKSVKTGTKRFQIPKVENKSGFSFIEVNPDVDNNRNALMIRQGIIGEDDEDSGYVFKRYLQSEDPTTSKELFKDNEARFTGEMLYFFGQNFQAIKTNYGDGDFFKTFSAGTGNPFRNIPNRTHSYFSNDLPAIDRRGRRLFRDTSGNVYHSGQLSELDNIQVTPIKQGSTWFTYEIEFDSSFKELGDVTDIDDEDYDEFYDDVEDLSKEEQLEIAVEKLTAEINRFYKNLSSTFVTGYAIQTIQDGKVIGEEFTTRKPREEELIGKRLVENVTAIKQDGSVHFWGMDDNNINANMGDTAMLTDREGKLISNIKPWDVFRVRINDDQYLSFEEFGRMNDTRKSIRLYKLLSQETTNPKIALEMNADMVELLSIAKLKRNRGGEDILLEREEKYNRHPAYIAHATSKDVPDLTRLGWLDMVKKELKFQNRVNVLKNADMRDATAVGLKNKTPYFIPLENKWKDHLTSQQNLEKVEDKEDRQNRIRARRLDKKATVQGKEVVL